MIDFLIDIFSKNKTREAIVFRDKLYSYEWLLNKITKSQKELRESEIEKGRVVALEGDFSPYSVAWLLTLIENRNIIVPIAPTTEAKRSEYLAVGEVEFTVTVDDAGNATIKKTGTQASHAIYKNLANSGAPGLVLFSSGSTGKSKAAVHDFSMLLEKFKTPRNTKRILAFLLFDHIGGINTLFYTLSNGGCLITVTDRKPEAIAQTIERHSVQILPTSPTFLNLMLLNQVHERYRLESLELITYGTEVMPETTLKRISEVYPKIQFQQTYGLSEIGILRSKSKARDSLWVKLGGDEFQVRVVDGLLEVKAQSAMRGYLNAPSPFTEDGWFKTGDMVEVDGEYYRILGRKSELINIGGEKVYPSEVESILMELEGVADAAVFAEKNPIMGNIIAARIKLTTNETLSDFRKRMRTILASKVQPYKIPQKIILMEDELYNSRFKKMR